MNNKWIKSILTAALSVLFVSSVLISIFGGGKAFGQALKTYGLHYEVCQYSYPVAAPTDKRDPAQPVQECKVDYNQAKGDIADGLAMLVFALPVAWFTFRNLRKESKDAKK